MPRTKIKTVVGFPKVSKRDNEAFDKALSTPESEIDYADNPPATPGGWVRGRDFWKSRQKNPVELAIPLDPDVLAWLQSLGKRAPRRLNTILRAAMKEAKAGK